MQKKYQLTNYETHEILYEGFYKSFVECLENAVLKKVDLTGIDLSGQNLSHANLDDAYMPMAKCVKTNFCGANMSEAVFDGADFTDSDLTYACLVQSSLRDVRMMGTSFAVTDVTDAIIERCVFSCPSVFSTLFQRAHIFHDNQFIHMNKTVRMNHVPIFVCGLPRDIVYLDHYIKIGSEFILKTDLLAAGNRHLEFLYGVEIARFIRPVLFEDCMAA